MPTFDETRWKQQAEADHVRTLALTMHNGQCSINEHWHEFALIVAEIGWEATDKELNTAFDRLVACVRRFNTVVYQAKRYPPDCTNDPLTSIQNIVFHMKQGRNASWRLSSVMNTDDNNPIFLIEGVSRLEWIVRWVERQIEHEVAFAALADDER